MLGMKKSIVILFIISVILTGFVACSGNSKNANIQNDSNETEKQTTNETGNEAANEDEVPAPDEIVKLVVAFPTWTGTPEDLTQVQEAMNEISREKIGVEVELLVTDFASYNQQMTLMLTGDEPLDIFITLGGLYFPSIQKGQLVDLEEDNLLETYGAGIIEAVGWEFIDACRVGGVLYGLPNNRDIAQGKGCAAVRTDLLEEIGYEFQNQGEIEKITLDELNEIYAKIHEAHPELEIYRPVTNSMMQFSNFDPLGGNVFGVLMDYGASLEVVNLFETDYYLEYCTRMHDYFNKGYISKDAATDTTPVGELVKAGTLASYTTAGKPGIKAQETNLCGQDMTIFQTMDDFITSSAAASFPWAIAHNCEDRVAAMKYLNLMYTDPDIMNLLAWGVEGVHYEMTDDGTIDFPEGVDATNSGYCHNMAWMMPNQFISHVWAGNDPNLWDRMKEFNDNAVKSAALGFAFDTAPVEAEITAVQNVYEQYQKSLEFGMMDPTTGIAEMNEKLKAAGLDIIINEKQTQLDRWAEEMDKN